MSASPPSILVHDRLGELLQVLGLAAGDPVPVQHHRLVLDGGTDLLEVALDGHPGSQRAALYQARGDQELWTMAYGRDQFSRLLELPDEVDHALVRAQMVR
jgi:hypothetical protein